MSLLSFDYFWAQIKFPKLAPESVRLKRNKNAALRVYVAQCKRENEMWKERLTFMKRVDR